MKQERRSDEGGQSMEREGRYVSLTKASDLYGISLKYLLDWKRTGRLNRLNGLALCGTREMVDTVLIERRLGLKRVPRPNGRNGKKTR